MKKIKLTCFTLVISSILALSGCSNDQAVEGEQRYAWALGTASAENTVTQIYAQKFADEVYRLSDGTMKIQVYPNSTIGGDRELLESCKSGDIPFVAQNTAPQVTFMPRLSVFDLPCTYYTIEEIRTAIDDEEFYNVIQEVYQEEGYKLLGYADQQFRVMTSNKKVENIEDFKGIKIRTMENSNHIAFWKALGANPTPMSYSEVYIGLQQGTIDAQENPYENITSSKLYEQQDYVINTNHIPHLVSLVVSDEFFQSLTKEQQDIIIEASEIAKEYAREASDARVDAQVTEIESTGTEILDVSDETMDDIIEAAQPVYDSIRAIAGDELVDAYLKYKK